MSKDKNDVVIIDLDRPRELKFNHTAMKTLVSLTGKTIEEIDQNIDLSDFESIETLIYCGLLKDAKDHGETLTPERTTELIDQAPNYIHTFEKITDAWRVAFGQPAVAEGNPEPPVEQSANEKRMTGKKA